MIYPLSRKPLTVRKHFESCKLHPCDVVLLDISIPKLSGVEVLKRIRAEHHALPVLILSVYPEEEYGLRMLRAGAAGYLTRERQHLLSFHPQARPRRSLVSPTLAERLAFGLETGAGEKLAHEILSDREYQVRRMLASGKTVADIAL